MSYSFPKKNREILLSILILTSIVYLPFIGNPFIFDDLPFFASGTASNFDFGNFNFHPRYFSYATLALIWKVSLDIPWAYRLVSLLTHGANTVLLFFFLSQLNRPRENHSKFGIYAAVAIFSVHPLCTYAVGYTVQLSILMATMFVLAMLICFTEALSTQRYWWYLLSIIFYFIAVFSKEHAITAASLTVALFFLFRHNVEVKWKALLATWASYGLIGILILLHMKSVIGITYEHDASMLTTYQNIQPTTSLQLLSILNQCGLFFKYILLWCVPNPAWVSIDMRTSFESTLSAWGIFKAIAFLAYGAIAGYLLIFSQSKKLIGFALIYPWTFFLVEFSTVRIQEPFVLYRSYLWMPGFLALMLAPISPIQHKKTYIVVTVSLLTVLTICSWNRLWVMGNEYRLWNDAAALLDNSDPIGAARIFYNRGRALQADQKWHESIQDFKKVIEMHPQIEQAHVNLAQAYYNLGQVDLALKAFDQAIRINPDYAYAYFGKAMTLKKMHRNDEALAAIEKACALKHSTSCMIAAFIKSKKTEAAN